MASAARLLLVDDDDANRDVLARRLKRGGYEVDVAADGPTCLEMVKERGYDMVLLDSMMPGMGGPEVLENIRKSWPATELPVIMVTALDDSAHIVTALQLGANDYITKPVDLPVAIARIETQLRGAAAAREAHRTRDLYELASRTSEDGLWDWDLCTDRVYYSPGWKATLGYKEDEVLSSPEAWFNRVDAADLPRVQKQIRDHLEGRTASFESEYRVRRMDGGCRWVENRASASRDAAGRAVRLVGHQADVTSRKTVDPVTSLPNRIWLAEELRQGVFGAPPAGMEPAGPALILLNIDQFDRIEQMLANNGSDRLLTAAADRLGSLLHRIANGRGVVLARSGDHQFAVFLRGGIEPEALFAMAASLQAAFGAPFSIDGELIFIELSAGIAFAPPGDPSDDLLRDATAALHRARERTTGRIEVFRSDLRRMKVEELRLESDLRLGLERSEFEVYYQPKIDLRTDEIDGMEALVRWNRPGHGLVQPASFIPAAERTGLIVPLGSYVLERACRDTADLRRTYPGLAVSVNISGRQLAEADLPEQVHACLDMASLEPGALRLEVTETFLVEDPERALAILSRLRDMGVGLKLDDIGSGYASLDYLQRFPFDSIKIDRSFVARLATSHESCAIVRAIAGLSRSLNMSVIAEGIEDRAQLEWLREIGCGYGQGYWFSKPVDLARLKKLLAQWPHQPDAYPLEMASVDTYSERATMRSSLNRREDRGNAE